MMTECSVFATEDMVFWTVTSTLISKRSSVGVSEWTYCFDKNCAHRELALIPHTQQKHSSTSHFVSHSSSTQEWISALLVQWLIIQHIQPRSKSIQHTSDCCRSSRHSSTRTLSNLLLQLRILLQKFVILLLDTHQSGLVVFQRCALCHRLCWQSLCWFLRYIIHRRRSVMVAGSWRKTWNRFESKSMC